MFPKSRMWAFSLCNCFDLVQDWGAAVVVGLNGRQLLQVLHRESILLCTQTHHLMKTKRDIQINMLLITLTEQGFFVLVSVCVYEHTPVCTGEMEDRRRNCLSGKSCRESLHYQSPLTPPGESIFPGWPLPGWKHRFEPQCQLKQQILPAELINSCVLMFLTHLSSWGLLCSRTRLHPKLLPRGGTQWSPLHHAKSSSQVCRTGQSSVHSPVHTQTGERWWGEGLKDKRGSAF